MGKLAKEFADIINEQDFCFEPLFKNRISKGEDICIKFYYY